MKNKRGWKANKNKKTKQAWKVKYEEWKANIELMFKSRI